MTVNEKQKTKAKTFRAMHRGPRLLLLPNVWDVASARVFEDAGFGALATTSGGIAFTLGYADRERISRDEMREAVARIAAAVHVPVTADVESGYGDRPEDAAQTARAVIAAGAVGMNLEDADHREEAKLFPLALQLEKIAAVREAAASADVPIVLNARTDVYLLEIGAPETRMKAAIERLAAFRDAGADCLFIPGLRDPATIAKFVQELRHPINILAGPGFSPIPELEQMGVARITLGSGPMRATLGLIQRMAQELKATGTYRALEGGIPYADVNRMLEARRNALP